MSLTVHRTILVVNVPYLDAHNVVEVDEAFGKYIANIPHGTRIPLDFHTVAYVSSAAIGILCQASKEEFRYTLLCMRVQPDVREVFDLLGWAIIPQFVLLPDGKCPACGGRFKYRPYRCAGCGTFDEERVVAEG